MQNITVTDVRCLPGDSAFLIDDGETSILYDTGFGFTGFSVAENVQKLLKDRKLDYIFLTHSHYDHALGSAYVLRIYPEAKVVAGSYAAEIFKRTGAKRIMRELDSKFAAACGINEYEFLADELRVDICCRDKDIISVGKMNFEVLELPGHTKCSIGFYEPKLKLLLSTETLGVFNGVDVIVPSYLVSYTASISSIEKVMELDIKRMISPHFGLLDETQTSFFMTHAKEANIAVAEEIRAAIMAGKSDSEITEAFISKYRKGYIEEIYPIDAAKLNTGIMLNLLRKEIGISS